MVKLHPKYQVLATSPTRYFLLEGGRGSGKSYAVHTILTLLSFEPGHKILFTRYTMRSANDSIIPEFIDKIQTMGLEDEFYITKDSIVNKVSGSEVIFRGIKTSSGDQTANLKSLEGISCWVLDEAEELTDEEKFDTIDLSVRQKGVQNRVILIMNPTTKAHWIYSRFHIANQVPERTNAIKDNVAYIHTTYLDNLEHLPDSYIANIQKIKERSPAKYDHKIMGGWLDKAEGVIFSNVQMGKFPKDVDPIFGMDFGFSIDPTTLVATYIDKARGKLYLKQHFYKPQLTTTDIYSLSKNTAGESLIVGDSAEPRLISELKTRGLNIVKALKPPGSIMDGIAMMQDYEIIVDPSSEDLMVEFNNYAWLESKVKPVDDWNHAIDASRYAIYYQLEKPNRGKYAVR